MAKLTDLRYLRKIETGWLFDPPQDAIDAGVVKRELFHDGRKARTAVPAYLEALDGWREGDLPSSVVTPKTRLRQLAASYMDTKHFRSLSESTRKVYSYGFRKICNTKITPSSNVGSLRLSELSAQVCQRIYEKWETDPDNTVRIFSVLISYAISLDAITHNPMSKIKKVKHDKRSVVWTQEQVEKFLDTAFEDFKYRNVGLIVLMAYEWMQRPKDMRLLKWESVDLDNRVVKFKQTKRGAEVTLPIPDNIHTMLVEQKRDFGFQEYVVPYLRSTDKAWRPYDRQQLSLLVNDILRLSGLPRELCAGDLRKTGICEAIEADVPITNLMSVTGHKNLSSLSPYVKHSLKAATIALDKRKAFKKA